MKKFIVVPFAVLFPFLLVAQTLSRSDMSTYAYEDMADWLRRLHGVYLMDYGVAGAPAVILPWGLHPWTVSAQRDGIPWSRVSDGLYDCNLDTPEELDAIRLSTHGLNATPTIEMITRKLATDSATTEFRLREGYYGFGRLDFAHGQKLSQKLVSEVRGRLFWYDGMRSQAENRYSESRFYNVTGWLDYKFSNVLSGELEYGGQNVNSKSPVVLLENSFARWPEIYTEREFGTAALNYRLGRVDLKLGLHARQDREKRTDPANGTQIFNLVERFHYGFADGLLSFTDGEVNARLAVESAEFGFADSRPLDQQAIEMTLSTRRDFQLFELSAHAHGKKLSGSSQVDMSATETLLGASVHVPVTPTFSIDGDVTKARSSTPAYWRIAMFDIIDRPLLVNSAFAFGRYFAGSHGNENARDYSDDRNIVAAGLNWHHDHSHFRVGWRVVENQGPLFETIDDTVYFNASSDQTTKWMGPELDGSIPLVLNMKLHTLTSAQLDPDQISRAVHTRSFTRLVYQRELFNSKLSLLAYTAYELIGRHRADSDVESKVVGPAHLLHLRIEGTIEGVTLIWGAENLTAQHYEYLPGYMMIRKEEYFGLKWTLKL